MKKLAAHFYSEQLILAGILLNTLVIYLHSFDSLHEYFPLFEWTDHAFTIYFLCELHVKILFSSQGLFRNFSTGIKEYFKDSSRLKFFEDQYEVLNSADALIIVTEWKSFREPNFDKMKSLMKSSVIFDGRNIYNPKDVKATGFEYLSIGRPS